MKRPTTRLLAMAALFGAIVFASKSVLPTPIDKIFLIPQAMFLALGFLMLSPPGATLVSVVGGVLTAAWRAPFAPLTLVFALVYGLMVDVFSSAFGARSRDGEVRVARLLCAMAISTGLTGSTSYYTTVHILGLLPRNPTLEAAILVAGVLSGVVGGYLAAVSWRKILRHLVT